MADSLRDARRDRSTPRRGDGRVPPHNLNAEESLLGALLLSRDAVGQVAEMRMQPDHFYKPAHQHIYAAIRGLAANGEPVDAVTVADELRRSGLLDEIGGAQTLLELQNATPAISNAGRYAKIVQDTALLRRLIGVAGEIAEIAYLEPDDVEKALDEAETKVFAVADDRVVESTRALGDLLPIALDRMQETCERGDSITGVATGFYDLDEILSGLQPSTLNIVGARPAMGKCVAWDTPLVDPHTGAVITAAELFETAPTRRSVSLAALDHDARLTTAQVSAFVDDGIKPVFIVETRAGRRIRVTAAHPLLTERGWQRLEHIAVGEHIATPSAMPIFGTDSMPPAELDLLALLIGDGSVGEGVCTPRLTTASAEVLDVARQAAAVFGARLTFDSEAGAASTWRLTAGRSGGSPNPITEMLRRHGVWGTTAHHKRVPAAVFRAPREQVAHFLNRLFATDGTAWVAAAGYARVGYATVSEQLSLDVAHLLLRFGIRSKRRTRWIRYGDQRRRAFEVEVMDSTSLRIFCDEIGILGKDDAVRRVAQRASDAQTGGFTIDTLPMAVWDDVVKAKGERSWASISAAAGKPRSHNWHPYRRRLRRETIALLADVLDDDRLRWWASPDVTWDRIVAITPDGLDRVIDFTVPGLHNFVAADIFVHNTAFGLGIATHVAQTTHKPVLVFSLEMGHAELTQRILSSEAEVDSQKMRTGKLIESDWTKIGRAINRLEVPLYLDDNPRVTVMEIRAKARRIKARQGGLALIVIDYLQLMGGSTSAENRQLEVSEISRGLKILARELEVPILALSQLSRNLETRSDKHPVLADLRESGSLEQDSDVVMFLYREEAYNRDNVAEKGAAEVIIAKHRSGPTGVVKLAFRGQYTKFGNAARGV